MSTKKVAVFVTFLYKDGMTGSELKVALRQMQLTQRGFAKMIEKREQTVSNWVNEWWPVPKEIELLVEQMRDSSNG